ncbi:putative calcium-binding protein CML13 [Glycine soja]
MGKDLSEEQVSSMKEAFSLFDTDGDGRIAPSELGILMRSLGGNPTQAQLKAIVAEENLTAPFDFPRFLDLMAKHIKPEPFDRQLRDAFKVLDKDSTGFVAVSELRHILTNIGEKLEPSEFDEWIREVDVGSDGKIRYEDFIARMVAKKIYLPGIGGQSQSWHILAQQQSSVHCINGIVVLHSAVDVLYYASPFFYVCCTLQSLPFVSIAEGRITDQFVQILTKFDKCSAARVDLMNKKSVYLGMGSNFVYRRKKNEVV